MSVSLASEKRGRTDAGGDVHTTDLCSLGWDNPRHWCEYTVNQSQRLFNDSALQEE